MAKKTLVALVSLKGKTPEQVADLMVEAFQRYRAAQKKVQAQAKKPKK